MAGSNARKASTPSKGPSVVKPSSAKRNKSILSFFQKSDGPTGAISSQPRITQFVTSSRSSSSGAVTPSKDDTANALFLEDKKGLAKLEQATSEANTNGRPRSRTPEDIWGDDDGFLKEDDHRYNENGSSSKRRKIESPLAPVKTEDVPKSAKSSAQVNAATSGPFIDESDSEDDMEAYREVEEMSPAPATTTNDRLFALDDDPAMDPPAEQPPVVREVMSLTDNDEYANFDDIEEDEPVGDEFREGPWEDQEGLKLDDLNDVEDMNGLDIKTDPGVTCPICQEALAGLSETDVSVHVNDCLDGKPSSTNTPTPTPTLIPSPKPIPVPPDSNKSMTRIERAAIARPAQRDPYTQSTAGTRSAFSKLMAGNAEDTAWAAAASNEASSRGNQAYQRTCPFYKIMPGFSICVDAFRFGAVEGCNAYFLSHFHSDHYIGLSKSWCHGPIYCSRPTGNLVRQQLRVDPKWVIDLEFETTFEVPNTGGVQVTMIHANHCPGSSLFLFEKSFGDGPNARRQRILHCGDFRASPPKLSIHCSDLTLSTRRLASRDNSALTSATSIPPISTRKDVIAACSELCVRLNQEAGVMLDSGSNGTSGLMNKFLSSVTGNDNRNKEQPSKNNGRLLVVIGTYSIGKERICLGIARALGSKIFATPQKQRICKCLEDPELSSLLTSDPKEAQVHMQTLFEIRADTLADYLDPLKPHFSRVVGFRPTGWSYRPPAGRKLQNPPVPTVLRGEHWRTPFTAQDLTPQRGSTRESACFGVPYSEHSSFRELTMFCCALRIGRVIPTVNVGSAKSRENMKAWIERWEAEKKRNGLFPVAEW
ncbi:DNA repair metallo-beta-lactamase [Penicillium maclennaniae]|uniref:DNA repair metallo-beta-lactamase n=1 Tax=Penicillium maclennaniae TaxID=1343394 RepID=UPI002541AEC4|nr:DNA repair metallo-beta-lactamase [Penicillium maclennaniae]KAJ5675281.1 DNA repair metallo-beta-lactamase [Penicillium maclennaniae]